MTDILTGAVSEANSVCQILIRQGALGTTLVYHGRRWRTQDLAVLVQQTRNHMNSLLFAIRTMHNAPSSRLTQDQSVILQLCEDNHIIGWQAGQMPFCLRLMQFIAEGAQTTQAQGQYVAHFARLHQMFEVLYQTRIFMSLYYHSLEPSN